MNEWCGRQKLIRLWGSQVPSPPDDEEDTLAIKRSKGTGGAVVGRWQETTARSRPQGGSPKATAKPAGPRKPKDPSVVEMLQYIKLYHLVPAQVTVPHIARSPAGD